LTENTLILFMVDNGPNGRRYVAGMRGHKTTVYEGGIRSPLFIHWPAHLNSEARNSEVVAHIDILPTILDACHIPVPDDLQLDGRSFFPLLSGTRTKWPDRSIVLQAHRGDRPVAYNNFALRTRDWKLLNPSGFHRESLEGEARFELYHMIDDPLEMQNLADSRPEIVNRLKLKYDKWFNNVSQTRSENYDPPRIPIGTKYENPVVLTRQDWRRISENPWLEKATGYWRLVSKQPGKFDIMIRFRNKDNNGLVNLTVGGRSYKQPLPQGQREIIFKNIEIEKGPIDLQAWLQMPGNIKVGSWQVEVKKN
jgi:arylsulfatase/arylsulfatase A